MNRLREILRDKLVNSLIVGLLLGIGTLNFINVDAVMLIDKLLGLNNNAWVWKSFWGNCILYIMIIIASLIIRRWGQESSHHQ